MHELGIANSILNTVLQERTRQKWPAVESIVLRIGLLSDVVPEALEFNFDIIKENTPLSQTRLVIERVPIKAECRTCQDEFAVENLGFACPQCGCGQIEITQGEELDIAYLEVEEQ